ncbi:MAG: hypothetical protein A2748_01195 [Candidatus Wildermuthbacteria bacterium RIFCSPHIGHO2_01_FULL_45_20]|uniref:VCBS repeat-containing protein n=1 Tax=Candidatus Wildermuthbacteria bacterium RIFCSPHIGHO2_02_FULL_45_25 TaxID=1802450 RepID=A0A1G2R6Z7_9BACT|nr:MAG: hypothetical protein A2748_01195 [Candidatus Wildermuthbacteria bacterium RIFCSPHIGHO2_01_FULL_45_20]OHA67861.1 MAG: hypothetical protein A3C04_02910 [Candidatus Wildermuthbacteria bacterium RIFCSPHIGHO2_02_FULL_45_25]
MKRKTSRGNAVRMTITLVFMMVLGGIFYWQTREKSEIHELTTTPSASSLPARLSLNDQFRKDTGRNYADNQILWLEQKDLTGDGMYEYVVGMAKEREAPVSSYQWQIFASDGVRYYVVYNREEGLYQAPEFHQQADINADGKEEVVVTERECGAHTCFVEVFIVQWNGTKWVNLAEGIEAFPGIFELQDENEDGIQEVRMEGGLISSLGAGLQREVTLLYAYEGPMKGYALSRTEKKQNDIYFIMLDANEALRKKEWVKAGELAKMVLENPNMTDSGMAPERSRVRIVSYAGILAMISVVAQNSDDIGRAEQIRQQLEQYREGDNPYVEAAQTLLQIYEETKDVSKACSAMETKSLAGGEAVADFFESYGYAQERMNLMNICPLLKL